jgi:hypothetical protein
VAPCALVDAPAPAATAMMTTIASTPVALSAVAFGDFIRNSPSWWIEPRCIDSGKAHLQSFCSARY